MVDHFYFKDRDGQTPLPRELQKGLIPKHIQTIGELDEFEETNIAEGLVWLGHYSKDDYLTYNFWLKLHKNLFGNVWSWAGEVRSHELNDPDFLRHTDIWPAFKKLEDDSKFWIENKTYDEKEFSARFHERIETIHPFNNGNGRFGRILTEYICEGQKFAIPTWGVKFKTNPAKRREIYIAGIVKARRERKFEDLMGFMFG
jgi:Fic-DOC domain mobile mystery protein B